MKSTDRKNRERRSTKTKLRVGGSMLAGFILIGAFFGGFGVWASLAPLDSAVIASGKIVVEGNRKTVQHLEGGIVKELLVRDGSIVDGGDVLIRLDPTQAQAQLNLLRGQYLAHKIQEGRLKAERDASPIQLPVDLVETAKSDPMLRELIAGQASIFEARRKFVASQQEIQEKRIAQLEEEIAGRRQEIASQDRELVLIAEEVAAVQKMLDLGYARKPRLLALQRNAAGIEGERANNVAEIARAKQAIGETKLAITDLENRLRNEIVQNLQTTQSEIDELSERIRAAEDVLERTEIKAPTAGTVVGLQVFTVGGVIAPQAPLMDIVPLGDRLIVDARISPTDIDLVHPGQKADVRLLAFSQRTTPPIEGVVEQVSADTLEDQKTGATFYLSRVALDFEHAGPELSEITIQPGMPVEVMIVTGTRTTFDYLLKPIATSVRRGIAQN